MNHLAIMRNPWYDLVKTGKKTIESRCYHLKIHKNDLIYFKRSGSYPISFRTIVQHVKKYVDHDVQDKLYEYRQEIGIDEAYIYEQREKVKLTLMWLGPIELINPFSIVKHDQRGWITDFHVPAKVRVIV